MRRDPQEVKEGRGSVGACPTGYQEGIPAGSCCTGAASLPDCDLERTVICDDEDGFWAQHCSKVYEHDRSLDHARDACSGQLRR